MKPADHTSGHLYEQVLELAKREIDEAAGQLEELKRSIQLVEARVEAAKSIYESVAARLNLEDEGESGYASAYQELPREVPEPPEPVEQSAPNALMNTVTNTVTNTVSPEPPSEEPVPAASSVAVPAEPPSDDLGLIRQHLAQKLDGNGSTHETNNTPAAPAPLSPPSDASGDDKDAFSMELIRRHLAEKDQTEVPASAPAPPIASQPSSVEAKPEPVAPTPEPSQGGLSEADRELIGAYLRSKQS